MLKREKNEEYDMSSSTTDALSIVAVILAIIGFITIVFSFQNLLTTKNIYDIASFSGFIIGAVVFCAAYYILR